MCIRLALFAIANNTTSMSKICLMLLLVVTLIAIGCKSADPGDREYVPGKGWVTK